MIETKWILSLGPGLDDAYAIRHEVFTLEQSFPQELDHDGNDDSAVHLVVFSGGKPVGCGRILKSPEGAILGRIAVLKRERGTGLGDLIVRMLIRKSCELGMETQLIHAQAYARGFYEKLGFEAFGEPDEVIGKPHLHMRHVGDVSGCRD
ncbi:MAG: GNAT family N-acetyltransferase [Clostridiales bacterium]|jgi:predicted GNAT family N-acyltransferase|nr:GNAT family N-acetyltransferase [Clostridiales bacterium]MDR2751972.1 GNAT family N-acetyltransferase [Clostridiales bacterium]